MAAIGKVVVLGCTHGGLAAIRSLGKRGLYIVGLTYKADEFGLTSRYLSEWHLCPHPRDEDAFVNYLLDNATDWGGALLIETNDYYLQTLSKYKARLSECYKLVSPDWEQTQIFLEKDKTYALADACGVPHPNIYRPTTLHELDAIASQLKFPVMIKPVLSHQFVSIFGEKLFITESMDELRGHFEKILDAQQPVILSEVIPGSDYKTLERIHIYINSKDQVSAALCNIKLRQTPPMYGVMRVGKSTAPNQEVLDLTHRLLGHVQYRGFASVEFKRDPRDNELKLMEVNIRQPRSAPLGIASGVDFPWLIYQDLVCNHQEIIADYHYDTYLIELIADITDFFRRDKNRNLQQFLRPYLAKRKTFSYLDWSDPMPFLRQLRIRSWRGMRKLSRVPASQNE